MIDSRVAVDEEDFGGLDVVLHPVAGELAAPEGGAGGVVTEDGGFFAEGFDFGDAIEAEAEEFAPFAGGLVVELFEAGDAAEGEIG